MSQAILADTVLSGAELEPIAPGVVVVDRGHILAVGTPEEIPLDDALETVAVTGSTLIPGFIDAHVHIGLVDPRAVVRGGVTSARDLGWPPKEIWPAVASSTADNWPGPKLIAAGQMLTAPGGYPTRAKWAPAGTGRAVEGVDDAAAAVMEQADAGASVIKVALNAAVGPTLDLEPLEAIVATARARGLSVTGHVTGLGELDKALGAGIRELAHMLMSEERIPSSMIGRMVEQQMVVVPTLACRFGSDRALAIDNLRRWLNAGGRVVYGTDLGNEGPEPGIDAREIEGLVAAGMSARAIVASATVDSARWLTLDDVGILDPGRRGDIVAVGGDPLADVSALLNVVGVWRAGRRMR